MIENNKRDAKTFSILSVDSPKLFQAVRAAKKVADVSVKKLTVKDRVYAGDDVCDGFFDSISPSKHWLIQIWIYLPTSSLQVRIMRTFLRFVKKSSRSQE